ncbi:DNA polymerase delta catalytic subunit [Hypsizygus marmoreus]|uniref:DNA polymerase delta catalytic subunit n=1 Tax=Hypsizygus marmoreus TaxID=39966 RepID=A0A369J7H1_HYPMA|nr:DNA polymerase delta catalytic subunit [Hypsizygus marmoreus]
MTSNLQASHTTIMALKPGSEESPERQRDGEGSETPTAKKSKLGPSESFADVLKDMKENEKNRGKNVFKANITGAKAWRRPHLKIDDNAKAIVFQLLDVREALNSDGSNIALLFGSTEDGHPVLARVLNFLPYLYFPAPPGFVEADLESLKENLNASHVFRSGRCDYRGLFILPEQTYETTVDYAQRFMLDMKVFILIFRSGHNMHVMSLQISGMSWIEVPANKYTIVSDDDKFSESECQLEFSVSYDNLKPLPHDEGSKWERIAPLRILSFDIETEVPQSGAFPNASNNAVFQIANMVKNHGDKNPFIVNIFTLKACTPIEGLEVHSYETEIELLQAWEAFIRAVDPDVITGFNVARFDIPFLIKRAKTINLEGFNLNRLYGMETQVPPSVLEWRLAPTLAGRMLLDVMHFIVTNMNLSGVGAYKLNAVTKRFLDEKKEDVHFSEILALQNGSLDTRRRLAIYCSKDAHLPLALMDKLECLAKNADVARKQYVCLYSLFLEGAQNGGSYVNPHLASMMAGHITPDLM